MELKELKCKNCGAQLKVDREAKEVTCNFCNTTFAVETKEDFGYEFEKGRIKAQKEEMQNNLKNLGDTLNNATKGLQSGFDSANEALSSEEIKKVGKISLIVFVVIFILFVCFIVFIGFNIFKGFSAQTHEVNNVFNTIDEVKDKMSVSDFNWDFETMHSPGTVNLSDIEDLFDDICTNNKKNKDHKVTVLYNEIESDDYNVITDLKSTLQVSNKNSFELSYEYNDKGYIYKAVVKDK